MIGGAVKVLRIGRALAALSVACMLGPIPAAHADEASVPRLLDVQLSESSVAVGGLAAHDVVVRVHLASYTGIVRNYSMSGFADPSVDVARTVEGRGQVTIAPLLSLTMTSGTAEDGWWEGTVHVTAGFDGTFAVTHVYATQSDDAWLSIDPRTLGIDAHLDVTGTDIPHVTLSQSPTVVTTGRDVTISGVLSSLDTGNPFAGVAVTIGSTARCADSSSDWPTTTTAADGRWHLTLPAWSLGAYDTLYVGADLAGPLPINVAFHDALTAHAAASHVRVGGTVRVLGTTSTFGARVILQRLSGARWRTVSSATAGIGGSFALTAQPPARGAFRYRVALPATRPNERANVTPAIVLLAR